VSANIDLARENSTYLRRLLNDKEPDFFAALQAAEREVALELSGDSLEWRTTDDNDSAVSP